MNITLMSCEKKRELLARFCLSYRGVLCQHDIYALSEISRVIFDSTQVKPVEYLSESYGGYQQVCSKISYNEMDLVIFFRDTSEIVNDETNGRNVLRLCDFYSVPIATNIATAEILIHGLARGDFEWRKIGIPTV